MKGFWQSNADNLEATSDASIFLGYTSSAVNIVADNGDMEIWLNGKLDSSGTDVLDSMVKVTEPRLYNVARGSYGTYILEIRVKKGFIFNAFTFG